MTEKENFMKLMRGECPEWIPTYTFGKILGDPNVPATAKIGPGLLFDFRKDPNGTDYWGVRYVSNEEGNFASIPKPNDFILDDITKWRDVIHAPSLEGIDWEAMAKRDIENSGINPEETAVIFHLHVGYFQNLMAFMGFTEGLCAMYEEPEEVKALFEYMSDFYVDVAERCIDYYHPDIFSVTDDTATKQNPFVSVDMYRELLKPFYIKQANVAMKRGIPIEMHNCGRCEDFIEDWFDFGVSAWNPAQPSNNLTAIKEKYGNSLALCGCWDAYGELADPNCSEEVFKDSIIKTIDAYAPGGGFAWGNNVLGFDEAAKRKNRWISEVMDTYGRTFYR